MASINQLGRIQPIKNYTQLQLKR